MKISQASSLTSSIEKLTKLDPSGQAVKEVLSELNPDEQAALVYEWNLWARPKQIIPPGDWFLWLILAGRGFGKTRTLVETGRFWKESYPIINVVGRTASDVRDILVEGESGILATAPPWDKPNYNPSKKKITWPNGAIYKLFTAEEPDSLRGPQCYKALCDEQAAWKYPGATWDNLLFGLRLGDNPQVVSTTTPRPIKLIKALAKDPDTHITNGSTYENRENLAGKFLKIVLGKYEGTSLGSQEIEGLILEEVEGALWQRAMIHHVSSAELPEMQRIIVAVDPAVTANKKSDGAHSDSDETGITVVGKGTDGKGYVLDNVSGIWTPNYWAKIAVRKYRQWQADRVVAEVNNGGDLVEANIRTVDKNISYKAVRASRGKQIRAEPVVSLYEQKRMLHVGSFPKMEDEMTTWDPNINDFSPNNMDALVWAASSLMLGPGGSFDFM